RALGYWLRPTLQRLDTVVSVSQPAQKLATDTFKLQTSIVPNMVDTASYKLSSQRQQHDPPHLLFLGRLVERKGCEHFIKTLALLDMPFKADIVGDGPLRPKLESLVQKLHLTDSITFHGRVSEDDKRRLLKKADLAIFPATGGESFGIVLLEAMAAGSC